MVRLQLICCIFNVSNVSQILLWILYQKSFKNCREKINDVNFVLNKKWQTINSMSELSSYKASCYLSSNLSKRRATSEKGEALYDVLRNVRKSWGFAAPWKILKSHFGELFTYFSNFLISSPARTRTSRCGKAKKNMVESLNEFGMENNWIRLKNYHKLAIWCPRILISLRGLLSWHTFDGSVAH